MHSSFHGRHATWRLAVLVVSGLLLTGCTRGTSTAMQDAGVNANAGTPARGGSTQAPPPAPVTVRITPETGGSASLGSAVSVHIPPAALSTSASVTVKLADPSRISGSLLGGKSMGRAYEVGLNSGELSKPATLELSFDPKILPPGMPKSSVFLAYFDATKEAWIPVGGIVDEQRNTVTVEANHFSVWQAWTWNWDAWIVAIKGTLSADLSDFLKGVATLTEPCTESSSTVTVSNAGGNHVIQGCITKEDPLHPQLRVLNLKSFYIGITCTVDGPSCPQPSMLESGDAVRFTANTDDRPPLSVYATFDDASMRWFVVSLVARMLPAGKLLNNDGITFIADGLNQVWDNHEIADALGARDSRAAAIKLVQLLRQEAFIQAFVKLSAQYGAEHGISLLSKWTTAGVQQVLIGVAAVDDIVSETDFFVNYFFNNRSQVSFAWPQPLPNYVEATAPADGAQEVSIFGAQGRVPSGGATIAVTFRKPVPSADVVQFAVTPPPIDCGHAFSVVSTFPNNTVTIKSELLLLLDTVYTVSVNYSGSQVYKFSFRTTAHPEVQGDSTAAGCGRQEILNRYPLASETPYRSANVCADYDAPLHMKVLVKSGTMAGARLEVEQWMRQKGIDPTSHTLQFVTVDFGVCRR